MKKIILFLLIFCMFSCKKAAIEDVTGLYNVTGEIVRCSYYYCDTTIINSTLDIQNSVNDYIYVYISLHESVVNDSVNLGRLEFIKTNPKEIVYSGHHTSKLTYDKETNFINYYRYINNNQQLEDTVSRYIRLEGYKQWKSVTFDISNAAKGNYSVVVIENSGSVDSRVLIKIN